MPKLRLVNGLSEKEIQNQILTWLWYNRIDAWPNDSIGVYDAKKGVFRRKSKFFVYGRPDIEGILPPNGRYLGIEVKTSIGVLSHKQREFLDRITDRGGIAFVARSLEDVIQVIGPYCASR